jgi:hypothetical protein
MNRKASLVFVKIVHTIIWLFFNVVIFYLLFAVIFNKIDKWIWIGIGCFAIEGIVLLVFKKSCPLTIVARRYSDSVKDNFDIYLPDWLAKYNKRIYSSILGLVFLILIYRLATNS